MGNSQYNNTQQNAPNTYQQIPVHPNGMPYSKGDYSALSNEYKNQRNKIVRNHNALGCVFVIIGMLLAGIWLPIMLVTQNTLISLLILGAGIVCLIIGGLQKPLGDKKINDLQEQSYANYINSLPNSNYQQSNAVHQSAPYQPQQNYVNYQPSNNQLNASSIQYCPNCGNKQNPDSIFCGTCGTKVR